jgi:hypothetical protein
MMPHLFLSRFIMLRMIRFVQADTVFYTLFKSMFYNLPVLIRNVGILPAGIGL